MLTCAPRVPSRKSRFEVRAARRRGRARSAAGAPSGRRTSAWSRSSPVARRTSAPGQRRHEHLGLEAGGRAPRAASTDLGGQHAVGDEEHVGVEAGALVAGPHLGDDAVDARPARRVRAASRSKTTTSSSCRYWSGATATQNSSGVASSVPSTRPTAGSGSVPPTPNPPSHRRPGAAPSLRPASDSEGVLRAAEPH